jgi:hypothetical protein
MALIKIIKKYNKYNNEENILIFNYYWDTGIILSKIIIWAIKQALVSLFIKI